MMFCKSRLRSKPDESNVCPNLSQCQKRNRKKGNKKWQQRCQPMKRSTLEQRFKNTMVAQDEFPDKNAFLTTSTLLA